MNMGQWLKLYRQGKSEAFGENPSTESLCPPQIPHDSPASGPWPAINLPDYVMAYRIVSVGLD